MTSSRLTALILSFLVPIMTLALGSCGDDDHITSPFGDKDTEIEDRSLGAISGTVVNVVGAPLSFAAVTVGERSGFADDLGRFFVPGLSLEEGIARFDKDSRTTTNFRALQLVAGGEVHFPDVMLLPLERGAVFYADAGGTAELGLLGSGATFSDSSFVSESEVYIDRVGAFMAVGTVGDTTFAAAFPGDFRGTRTDAVEIPFDALGVIWTYIDSRAGQLELAPGKTVTYRLGVDTGGGAPAPATAIVWTLDLETGLWLEVGESVLADGVYEIEVGSIAPVCWAVPATDQCEVSGMVRDNAGRLLDNARVECRDLAGRFRQAVMTAEDGSFSLQISRSDDAEVAAYFGSITGAPATVNTEANCPAVIVDPLVITLPDFNIDLTWTPGYGDLDAHYFVVGEWVINYLRSGSLGRAPYAELQVDEREGGLPETILGQRWYDGTSEYWIHDYQNRLTEDLRESGASVELMINDQAWSFAASDADYDPAESDSSGWWHVFDIVVKGTSVEVDTVQTFAPAP